jgi:hypothetical protein
LPLRTELDSNWRALMALCAQERELAEQGHHPKVLRLVRSQIEHLARDMGFSALKIQTRDFRARKLAGRIVAIDTT